MPLSLEEEFLTDSPKSVPELAAPAAESLRNMLLRGSDKSQIDDYDNWIATNSDPVLAATFLHRPPDDVSFVTAGLHVLEDFIKNDLPAGAPMSRWGVERAFRLGGDLAVLRDHSPDFFTVEADIHLGSRLRSPLHSWGAAHEISTAAHLVRRGAEVEPHFLKNSSPEEILAIWPEASIPVQCKVKLPGSGRKVADETFVFLGGMICRDIGASGNSSKVVIETTGSIPMDHVEPLRLAVASGRGLSGPELFQIGERTYLLRAEMISSVIKEMEAAIFLDSHDCHVGMMVADPNEGNIPNLQGTHSVRALVCLHATPEEHPWRSLRESLDDAAKQLEGGSPGIIAIHYADHYTDFESLRPDMGSMKYLRKKLTGSGEVQAGEDRMGIGLSWKFEDVAHVGAVMVSTEPGFLSGGAPGGVRTYLFHDRIPAEVRDRLGQPVN